MRRSTGTGRLVLVPLDPSDEAMVRAVAAIEMDPRTWNHLPQARPLDDASTRTQMERHAHSWNTVGLGWWAVTLRDDVDALPAGSVIGLGGAAATLSGIPAWNLGYRLAPEAWGKGFATELGRATITAANAAQQDYPVTARALTRNEASCRVLERLGLAVQWEGPVPDPALLTAGLSLSIYADRPLTPETLAAQLALG